MVSRLFLQTIYRRFGEPLLSVCKQSANHITFNVAIIQVTKLASIQTYASYVISKVAPKLRVKVTCQSCVSKLRVNEAVSMKLCERSCVNGAVDGAVDIPSPSKLSIGF